MRECDSGGYPRRPDHVVWKVIEDKGILLSLDDGSYFEVDPVGLSIWERCDGKTPVAKMTRAIAERFRVDAQRVARDLPPYLRALEKSRLIRMESKPHSSSGRSPS